MKNYINTGSQVETGVIPLTPNDEAQRTDNSSGFLNPKRQKETRTMKESLSDRLVVGNPSIDELTERWFSLRLSGDWVKARQIKQYIERLKVENQPVSSVSTDARVAPAASVCAATAEGSDIIPRSGNTGVTYPPEPSFSRKPVREFAKPAMKSGLVIVDYLTVTFGLDGESEKCIQLWNEITDLMFDHGIELRARDKGLYSYHNSALLHVPGSTGDGHNCGFVAWTDEDGVTGLMVEITGAGCEFLRASGEYDGMLEMYSLILAYGGRISRVDLALDLMHSYCRESNITVPMLGKRGNAGEFRSDFAPAHIKQKENQQGDWSDITFNGLSPEEYNPELHGIGGLTYYFGSPKSDNQIVFYEKGKQLLGGISGLSEKQQVEFRALSEKESRNALEQKRFVTLSDKSGYDGQYEDKKCWVRVERRMRRKNSKKIIDPNVLLDPDSAFCWGFKGLRAVLDDYSVWVKGTYADITTFQNKRVNMVKAVLLSRKAHWAKIQAGSFVRTLIAEGYSDTEIVDTLKREEGLKEYVFDLLELV